MKHLTLWCCIVAWIFILREYAIIGIIPTTLSILLSNTPQKGLFFSEILAYIAGYVILKIHISPYNFFCTSPYFELLGTSRRSNFFQEPLVHFPPTSSIKGFLWLSITYLSFFQVAGKMKPISRSPLLLNLMGIVTIGLSILFCLKSGKHILEFTKIDQLCHNFQWKEALSAIDKQWEQEREVSPQSKRFQLLCAQTKSCLIATRQATNRLFTYPQPYFPMLFPQEIVNFPECYILGNLYLYIGCFAENLHINYDLLTGRNLSARILGDLHFTSTILQDSLPASKFAYMLNQSLYGKELLKKNQKKLEETGDRMHGMIPPVDHAVNTYFPDVNIETNYRYRPDNPYFYEYHLCLLMLQKKPQSIAAEWKKIKEFYQIDQGRTTPRHIQECLLANFNYDPTSMAYPKSMEGITTETWNDYWNFLSENQEYIEGRIPFSSLKKRWQHTYWFYDLYMKIVHPRNHGSQYVN